MDSLLNPKCFTLVRLDGHGFSRFINSCKLNKPFDEDFTNAMKETAMECFKKMDFFEFGFVGSDEITFYLPPIKSYNSIMPFAGRKDKLISISSGMASTVFYKKLASYIGYEDLEHLVPHFDCRILQVETFAEVISNIKERILFTIKNSRMMFAQKYISHTILNNMSSRDAIDLVLEKTGHEYYDDVHVDNRIGSLIVKGENSVEKDINIKGEIKHFKFQRYIPEFHNVSPKDIECVLISSQVSLRKNFQKKSLQKKVLQKKVLQKSF